QENQSSDDDVIEKSAPELFYISKQEKILEDNDEYRSITPPINDGVNKSEPILYYITGCEPAHTVTLSPTNDDLNTPINKYKHSKTTVNPRLYYINRSESSLSLNNVRQNSNTPDGRYDDRVPLIQSSSQIPSIYSPSPRKQAVAFEINDDNDIEKEQPEPPWRIKSDRISPENVILSPLSRASNSLQRNL
ncbi:unnamed protein product, partial [Didymodactylos carnosus]